MLIPSINPPICLISIHALHEESDNFFKYLYRSGKVFQSTLSMRRATSPSKAVNSASSDFNPRSP